MSGGRTSCIVRPPTERYAVIWRGYVRLCDGNVCAAALLSVFEYWTNIRLSNAEQEDADLWVFRSQDELAEDAGTGWKRDAVRSALALLLEKGLIEQRNNPEKGWDRKFQYRLNVEAAQAAFLMDSHSRESDNASTEIPNMVGEVRITTDTPESDSSSEVQEPDNGSAGQSGKPADALADIPPSIVGNPPSNTEVTKKEGVVCVEGAHGREDDLILAELGALAEQLGKPAPTRDAIRRIRRAYPKGDHLAMANEARAWISGRTLSKSVADFYRDWLAKNQHDAPPAFGQGKGKPNPAADGDRSRRARAADALWVAEHCPELDVEAAITSLRMLRQSDPDHKDPTPERVRARVQRSQRRRASQSTTEEVAA